MSTAACPRSVFCIKPDKHKGACNTDKDAKILLLIQQAHAKDAKIAELAEEVAAHQQAIAAHAKTHESYGPETKGAKLCAMLNSQRAEVQKVRAELENGRAEVEKMRAEVEIAGTKMEEERAELENDRAELEKARADLENDCAELAIKCAKMEEERAKMEGKMLTLEGDVFRNVFAAIESVQATRKSAATVQMPTEAELQVMEGAVEALQEEGLQLRIRLNERMQALQAAGAVEALEEGLQALQAAGAVEAAEEPDEEELAVALEESPLPQRKPCKRNEKCVKLSGHVGKCRECKPGEKFGPTGTVVGRKTASHTPPTAM